MAELNRTPVTERAEQDKRAEGELHPLSHRRMQKAVGNTLANDITGTEALPISRTGGDQFIKRREELGYTHRRIGDSLARREKTRILPDGEPIRYGGTMDDIDS